MGQEALCTVRIGKRSSKGKAHLETAELIFRGEFRLVIPFREMKSVSAMDGELRVKFPEGTASFTLGPQAEKWAHKILHPKSLLDKLGVKPGAVVSVVGVSDAGFLQQLSERTKEIARGNPRKDSAIIFFAAESKPGLNRLRGLIPFIERSGAIWVVYPKGQSHITEGDVLAAGKSAGLVDIKVASFSSTHTALKFVIPVSRR